MTVRVYRWDDASAPVLTGEVGKLAALLKACLVTGYGAKNPIPLSSSTTPQATATTPVFLTT